MCDAYIFELQILLPVHILRTSSIKHAYLEARAVLAEGGLHLQLLLNGRVRQLRAMALHLGGRPEGALQPARRVLHVLQLPLQPLELRLALRTVSEHAATRRVWTGGTNGTNDGSDG